ncbi:tyrosyl-DNA phosphodiesterase 2-like [Liolophura sinensis]|uniref:tyrosyl-DNA phosphodiesterase 2-like n=1 Tax=Liolophura sinensis TaxID=3198878 RepID=UPI0031597CC5
MSIRRYEERQRASRYTMKLICWNINGLQSKNLRLRTLAVCDVINTEHPEVVFLQEVIRQTFLMLKKECPHYTVLQASDKDYFTAILLRKSCVTVEEHVVHPFPTSVMARKLQTVKCIVNNVQCYLMTSHLESMDSHDEERKKQLLVALQAMENVDKDRAVIFGGDLNIRDKEITDVGGLPDNILDLWEITGSRPEHQYTWDYWQGQLNHVKVAKETRFRFDRIYLRRNARPSLIPTNFKMVGLEKLSSCHDFASDHWGIMVTFAIRRR